jgi:formylglycine-generating enzyme required for sulfatase activity
LTFAQWDACYELGGCRNRPDDNGWGRGDRPLIHVTWDEAQQHTNWLSKQTGKTYRLLSEAEWEYAARAGTATVYYWGDDIGTANANCNGCGSRWGGKETASIESFKPNPFGLYDMAGNVWQWVQDCHSDDYSATPADGSAWDEPACKSRVVRGGSWFDLPRDLRSANRYSGPKTLASAPSASASGEQLFTE